MHYFTISGFENFLRNTLIGNYTGKQDTSLTNISTWFLPCLFFTGLYYYIIDKYINWKLLKLIIIIMLSVMIFLESKYFQYRLPLGIDIAFMGLLFYGLGNIFKSEITTIASWVNPKFLLFIPILIAANILFLLNDPNMSTNEYGNYYKYILGAASGIFTLLIISKVIGKSFLGFWGTNSIIVLCMEWIKGLAYSLMIILSFHLLTKDRGYLSGSVQFLTCLLLMIPIIFIINRYFYFLIGSSQKIDSKYITKEETVEKN